MERNCFLGIKKQGDWFNTQLLLSTLHSIFFFFLFSFLTARVECSTHTGPIDAQVVDCATCTLSPLYDNSSPF